MLEIGQSLQQGRYHIKAHLNQGGMGMVYLAADHHLSERLVAIKENLDIDPETQKQFLREAVILAQLTHLHLPRVTDHFIEPSGRQYLAMDYIDGENFQEIMAAQGGPLPEAEVLPWIGEVMDALEFMHNWVDPSTGQPSPIIHRDIKPSNIKRTRNGRIVLVDFGLAKYHTTAGTQLTARAVTPGYSPMEQYTGGTDVRSDIYALGATLYALLTGEKPPDSLTIAGGKPLTPPRKLNPQISRGTENAILRAMQIQTRNRFPSIAEMRAALGTRRPPQVKRPPPPPQDHALTQPAAKSAAQGQQPIRLNFVSLLALLGAAGLVAALFYLGLHRDLLSIGVSAPPEGNTAAPPTATFPPAPPTPTLNATQWGAQPPPHPITGTVWTDPKYKLSFAYVPAGAFQMGAANGSPDVQPNEQPSHTVVLNAFWIMVTEVTNAQYGLCVQANICSPPLNAIWDQPANAQLPVTHVSWNQATVYAAWVGGRLPSEAEWEKAARGTDGRLYPWGNTWDGTRLNYCDLKCQRSWHDTQTDDGFALAAPVRSYPSASPYQLFDMAGNVREWTSSLLLPYPYRPDDGRENRTTRASRVVRGGYWGDQPKEVRVAHRSLAQPTYQSEEVGFRLAR